MAAERPVLWQVGISHYSEKARWALAWKGLEHERRTPPPPSHMAAALWLTQGAQYTLPVLRLDGEIIGGSSTIIGALEKRNPEPPLYPDDVAERRRALDLEERFDSELAPAVRQVSWNAIRADREGLTELVAAQLPRALRTVGPARTGAAAMISAFTALRYRAGDDQLADRSRATVFEHVTMIESALADGGGEYLVGGAFSVADLAGACALYPLVRPPQAPTLPDPPARLVPLLDELRGGVAWSWVERCFARHRSGATAAA